MENFNLQVVLLVIGALVVIFVVWDSKRRNKPEQEIEPAPNQDDLEEYLTEVDESGYNALGVGLSRIIADDEEGLIAQRDDSVNLVDESMVASRDEAGETTAVEQRPELIIAVTILAKAESGFNGEKLLHCMLSRGLRFGDMDIFHRHKHTSGEGPVQFSLANALKPGTFNLDNMDSFKTRAVTVFMIVPGPTGPIKAYELMLDTAQHLATELDGQLLDDSKSVLTQQTIQHFKEQILDFERKNIGQ